MEPRVQLKLSPRQETNNDIISFIYIDRNIKIYLYSTLKKINNIFIYFMLLTKNNIANN